MLFTDMISGGDIHHTTLHAIVEGARSIANAVNMNIDVFVTGGAYDRDGKLYTFSIPTLLDMEKTKEEWFYTTKEGIPAIRPEEGKWVLLLIYFVPRIEVKE